MSTVRQTAGRLGALFTAAAIAVANLLGCSTGLPKTYPVKGKVVFKGGKPVTDGRIEFRWTSDEKVIASGDINPDGSFTLTTYKEGKHVKGAAEGPHHVVVELERPTAVVALPVVYTVEPQENDFTIEIQAPAVKNRPPAIRRSGAPGG